VTKKLWSVYVLLDPRDGEARYVGVSQDVRRRFNAHMSTAKRGLNMYNVTRWIGGLLKRGLTPILCVVETGISDWVQAEKGWIAHLKHAGCRLVNSTDGGEGTPGRRHSMEAKTKTSLALKGHPVSTETRLKLSTLLKGRKLSAGHLANVRAAASRRIGVPRTPETKAKISASKMGHAGYFHSLEHRKKMSEWMKNRKVSAETRARLSSALMGHPGVKFTLELRAKMSASLRAYHAKKRGVV
jgi:hypothetical protein